ncbi:MAG: Crp/Fnr family transcriptional regulator [Cyanobacteria bacterium P01_F01_bin.53]
MHNSTLNLSPLDLPPVRTFKRRENIPLKENILWQIRVGAVRLFTISEDGSVITLGFWGAGGLTGHPLACIQPCQIECLTHVEAVLLNINQCWDLPQVMLDHICQMQELIRIRHGHILQRLKLLLHWLASKFGCPTEQGYLIQLRLTHQQLAEAIGTSRVTVTRLLQKLELNDVIRYSEQQCIILRHC